MCRNNGSVESFSRFEEDREALKAAKTHVLLTVASHPGADVEAEVAKRLPALVSAEVSAQLAQQKG